MVALNIFWTWYFAYKQSRPKDDSVLQRGMSDQEGEPDYLNQANQNTIISVFQMFYRFSFVKRWNFFVSDWTRPFHYTGESWKDWQATDSEWENNKESHWWDGVPSFGSEEFIQCRFSWTTIKTPSNWNPDWTNNTSSWAETYRLVCKLWFRKRSWEILMKGMFLLQAQTESPFLLDVSTLRDGRGAIVFDRKKMAPRKRRLWTLERAGEMTFTLEKNELQGNSRITISGFKTTQYYNSTDHLEEVYLK